MRFRFVKLRGRIDNDVVRRRAAAALLARTEEALSIDPRWSPK